MAEFTERWWQICLHTICSMILEVRDVRDAGLKFFGSGGAVPFLEDSGNIGIFPIKWQCADIGRLRKIAIVR